MSPQYIPDRNDITWLDFEPTKDREIGQYRPALVLSSKAYNRQTGLLICCPVSTSIRGGSIEVSVNNLGEASIVAAGLVQTLDWKNRQTKFITCTESGVMDEVLLRLLPLMGANKLIEKIVNKSLE